MFKVIMKIAMATTFVAETNPPTLTQLFYIMTKKDFEFLASIVRMVRNEVPVDMIEGSIANYCIQQNSRFDEDRFRDACKPLVVREV